MTSTAQGGNGKAPNAPETVAEMKKATRPSNLFPRNTLEDALKVASAIEDANAGQPYPPTDLAITLGRSPGSSAFAIALSSSLKYGLTTGNYKSSRVEMTSLGQRITAPTSSDERAQSLVEAALKPATFSAAYEYLKSKKLPDAQHLSNMFHREFGIPKDLTESCAEIFRANLQFVGLLRQASTGLWVSADASNPSTSTIEDDLIVDDDDGSSEIEPISEVPVEPPTVRPEPEKPKRPKAIFIGHGPNKAPVMQLTKILDEYALPYKLAEYEPNAGRPISQKVADTMRECGAAILIFTADRELRDLDGNPVWMSSVNVAHELGAAAWQYDNRVVIFKEAGVDLASNFSGIGYIEFERDRLSAHAVELFRELVHFGLVKISVGD
jgi:hypothetical protein